MFRETLVAVLFIFFTTSAVGNSMAWTSDEFDSIQITFPVGGESLVVGQQYNITWTTDGNVGNVRIEYITKKDSNWIKIVESTSNDHSYSWKVPDEPSTTCLVKITDTKDENISGVSKSFFSIVSPGSGIAEISINRTRLNFGSITSSSPPSQTFLITNSGGGILNWSVTDDAAWISSSPASGTGSAEVAVTVNPTGLSAGIYNGTITVSAPTASNSPQTLAVALRIYQAGHDSYPFGDFATPNDGSTVYSSIAVTGWVLDDIGIDNVKIYREQGGSRFYIGDAILVEGARPDVAVAFPEYPNNTKAGWGYMMVTNFLPNGGNGTFVFSVIATDVTGKSAAIGTKTIYCDNVNADKPFGAIDTPTQGGAASGTNFVNWGWALTPQPNNIPIDGTTIDVFIDGVNIGHPTYNIYRSDIATLFPSYANSNGAIGYFRLNTTTYSNGVHTIQWVAKDSGNNSDGIGSRYFTIQNTGNSDFSKSADSQGLCKHKNVQRRSYKLSQRDDIPCDIFEPIKIKKNIGKDAQIQLVYPDENYIYQIKLKEKDRIVIELSGEVDVVEGFTIIENHLWPLPIGSTLNTRSRRFYWQPGPGFVGEYRFVFFEESKNSHVYQKNLLIRIDPQFN